MKTLSDADCSQVNFTPMDATVHSLRLLIKPASYPANSRVSDVEKTTYTVSVSLVSMKLEDDRDIHLVVADPSTSETMIVEFPDVACSGAINSAKKAEMQAARSSLMSACGSAPTSSFKSLSGTATLTGVGFFDVIHGQTGVAPNGIELDPILSFSGSCGSGGATPTATSSAAAKTPQATPTTTTSSYSVPACYVAGANTCNCADFTTHSQAQWFPDAYDRVDVNRLDTDHDGMVCESLPG